MGKPLTPQSTIEEVSATSPSAATILSSRGVDPLAGHLSLEAAALHAGLDGTALGSLVEELRVAEAPQELIAASDSVRAVLAKFPATAAVFAKRGIAGCGGDQGPEERLDLFAIAHRVPLAGLLQELRAVAAQPASTPPTKPLMVAEGPPIFRRFVRASLWSTLTFGVFFGAVNLVFNHIQLHSLPVTHAPVHATFQVFGFIFLFIAGVAFHALPRFFGVPLSSPRIATSIVPLVLWGLLARTSGLFFAARFGAGAAAANLLGALLLLSATVVFAVTLWRTRKQRVAAREPFEEWLAAGTAFFVISAALLVFGAAEGLEEGDVLASLCCNEAAWQAALFGGALCWIFGMLGRISAAFLGLVALDARRSRGHLLRVLAAVTLAVVGAFARGAGEEWGTLANAVGLTALGVESVLLTWRLGIFKTRKLRLESDPSFVRGVRLAFAGLLLFAALAALNLGFALTTGTSTLVLDAVRHAFALGFLTVITLAVAGRVLPIFAGAPLALARSRDWAFAAIGVGVVIRVLEIVAARAWAPLFQLTAWSGFLSAGGVTVLAAGLLRTLSARPAEPARRAGKAPLAVTTKVRALIDDYPGALEILLAHGFSPLGSAAGRDTLARMVTLEQACAMHGRDANRILEEIAASARPAAPAPAAPPPRLPVPRPATNPEEAVREALRQVIDPELGVSVIDLGLIYEVKVEDGDARVVMTFTSPDCPASDELALEVQRAVSGVPGIVGVDLDFVFEPKWTPDRIAPAMRAELGL